MQTGPACSLPSFTVGALPPAVLHSSPSPHQASPQGKLCPCCPGPVWAPGGCGQRCGSPSRCLVATNVVRFCLGAFWCGCSSPGNVLCMANELLVARDSCSTPFSLLPLLLEGFSRKPSPGNHVVIRCAPKRAFCSMVAWLSACGARVHAEMLLRGFGGSSASCHRCSLSPVANCNAGERCRAWGLLHPERPAGECCWVRKGQTRPLPARPCREVGRSRAGCCRPVTRLSLPAGWRSLASTTPTSGRLLPPCPAR